MPRGRTSLLAQLQQDQHARLRGGRGGLVHSTQPLFAEDTLLKSAEQAVRRRIWWRRTVPLNALFLIPSLLFVGTRSPVVLIVLVASYPLVFVLRAILARALSAWIGPEEILVRNEYERLRKKRNTGD